MVKDTEDRQIDFFDGLDLEELGLKIISYSMFLVENDAYTILDNSETSETLYNINIEEPSTDLNNKPSSPLKKEVPTTDTKVFYIRLSDFLSENEKLLDAKAVAY